MSETSATYRRIPLVLGSGSQFRERYAELVKGDLVVGQLNLKKCEESVFVDLVERGICLMPPALSQQLSRSKCLQALIYSEYMPRGTQIIRCRHDLVSAMETYGRLNIGKVITKQDRLDCGLGINLWSSIEDVFNMLCFGNMDFPFVIQPFISDALDVRVLVLGKYHTEAYWRQNSCSFRNNLHFGGESGTFDLQTKHKTLCAGIVKRGKFPYAHIDLMITSDDRCFLSEISLRGGIRGADISPARYRAIIQRIHEDFINSKVSRAT